MPGKNFYLFFNYFKDQYNTSPSFAILGYVKKICDFLSEKKWERLKVKKINLLAQNLNKKNLQKI